MLTKSENLFEKAKNYIPGGVNSPVRAFRSVKGTPLFITRAEGSKVYDADGNLVEKITTITEEDDDTIYYPSQPYRPWETWYYHTGNPPLDLTKITCGTCEISEDDIQSGRVQMTYTANSSGGIKFPTRPEVTD